MFRSVDAQLNLLLAGLLLGLLLDVRFSGGCHGVSHYVSFEHC